MKVPVRGGCVKVVAASVAAVLLLPLCCGTQGSDLAAFPRPIKEVVLAAPGRAAPGTESLVSVQVIDDTRAPVPGRQLAEIHVTGADGQPWPGVQRYRRITDGRLSLPLRLPLTAPCGIWRVEVLEWTSGLLAVAQMTVQ